MALIINTIFKEKNEMMNPKNLIKQMVDFNKSAFYGSFKGFLQMQEQAEQMTISLYDKTPYFPEAYKKAMSAFVTAHKNLHDNIIAMMDDSFKKVEEYLAD
jgi:hypothetical protein